MFREPPQHQFPESLGDVADARLNRHTMEIGLPTTPAVSKESPPGTAERQSTRRRKHALPPLAEDPFPVEHGEKWAHRGTTQDEDSVS